MIALLKSDRFGMEIFYGINKCCYSSFVKIRPFWYGNIGTENAKQPI